MAALSHTHLSILSDLQWKSLFSEDIYRKVKKKDPSVLPSDKKLVIAHGLKYLIALDQPDDTICGFIDVLKMSNSTQINSSFPHHRITALHVAIMRNRSVVVDKLIEVGASVTAQDEHGWFPLHHAALISNHLVQLLLQNGAKVDARTQLGGNYKDLLGLAGIERTSDRALLSYKALSKESEEIHSSSLSERLKMDYVDECMWPEKFLFHLWTEIPEKERGRSLNQMQISEELYPQFKTNPLKIILNETQALGIDAMAGQFIAPFTLIGEYTGEIVKEKKGILDSNVQLTYSFLLKEERNYTISVDAEKMGNWTRYMNDGFPNVFSFDLFNTAGQKYRKVFFVADPEGIRDGESLFYDYTWRYHTLKWGHYVLVEKEKMRSFFRNFDEHYKNLIQIYNEMEQPTNPNQHVNYSQIIQFRALEARLLYPFQTPLALMDLVFSQTIDPCEWVDFLENEKKNKESLFKCVFEEGNSYQTKLEKLLWSLMAFDIAAKKLSIETPGQDIMKKIRQLFLTKENILTVDELRCKLEELNRFFNLKSLGIRSSFTRTEIEDISKELDNKINELFI